MARLLHIRRSFAARLKLALDSMGVPESDQPVLLANLAGVRSELSVKWLQGIAEPGRTTISHIALHLQVRPALLTDGHGEMKAATPVPASAGLYKP